MLDLLPAGVSHCCASVQAKVAIKDLSLGSSIQEIVMSDPKDITKKVATVKVKLEFFAN